MCALMRVLPRSLSCVYFLVPVWGQNLADGSSSSTWCDPVGHWDEPVGSVTSVLPCRSDDLFWIGEIGHSRWGILRFDSSKLRLSIHTLPVIGHKRAAFLILRTIGTLYIELGENHLFAKFLHASHIYC